MSIGLAAVVSGPARHLFVKGIDEASNPDGHARYVREREVAALVPRHPAIPRLVAGATVEEAGTRWSISAFEAVAGETPSHPWSAEQLIRVIDAWGELEPVLHATEVPDTDPGLVELFTQWSAIASEPTDPWQPLAAFWTGRCREFAHASTGGTEAVTSHIDLRADNILIGERVWFVDWAHPGPAAPWMDVFLIVVDAAGSGSDTGQGGEVDLIRLWETHPTTRRWPRDLLITGAAALAAMLHVRTRRPIAALPHRHTWARALADGLIDFAERHKKLLRCPPA